MVGGRDRASDVGDLLMARMHSWLGLVPPRSPKCCVGTIGGNQLVVGADLADTAVLHHGDTVCVVGRVQAVGDRDNGAPLDHGSQ